MKIILFIWLFASINLIAYSQSSDTLISGTFIDQRDGQKYKWIKIGNQIWMAENLKYNAKGSTFYERNSENYHRYGRLYSWEIAQEVCPAGWHLPSINEWYSLINSCGEIFDENGKIPYKELTKNQKKEISQRYKETFSLLQEGNASGFSVLYGGSYDPYPPRLNADPNSCYSSLGTIAAFWSSDDQVEKGVFKSIKAYGFHFKKWGKSFYVITVKKSIKCSVRCIKNQ